LHGRGSNVAEAELAAPAEPCLGRRIVSIEELIRQVATWRDERHGAQVGARWEFTTANTCVELRKVDPSLHRWWRPIMRYCWRIGPGRRGSACDMSKSDGRMAKSPWLGILWCALGLLPLVVGAVLLITAADHYVAVELEVRRFDPKPGEEGQGRLIEGVTHPGGEPVLTSDSYLAIRQFVSPADRSGRRVPLREEIESQRLPVWCWPRYAEAARWWYPPPVVMAGATQQGGAAVRDSLLGLSFVGLGLSCVRRGARFLRSAVRSSG